MGLPIYLLIVAILFLILAFIFNLIKNRYKQKLQKHIDNKNSYEKRLEFLKSIGDKKEKFSKLDKIIKEFLREKFEFSQNKSYSQMGEELKEKNKPGSQLCKKMNELSYKKEKITKKDNKKVLRLISNLIEASKE